MPVCRVFHPQTRNCGIGNRNEDADWAVCGGKGLRSELDSGHGVRSLGPARVRGLYATDLPRHGHPNNGGEWHAGSFEVSEDRLNSRLCQLVKNGPGGCGDKVWQRELNATSLHGQLGHVSDLDDHHGTGRNVADIESEDVWLFLLLFQQVRAVPGFDRSLVLFAGLFLLFDPADDVLLVDVRFEAADGGAIVDSKDVLGFHQACPHVCVLLKDCHVCG
mmetsp:Transcript_970/g.3232  ORF Transcript_970/g.3232 Transcript_970/m.3232 type:complete len:219 (-) Transcript_970:2708-3364(-)